MRKFLFSFFVILLAKHASSVSDEQVYLTEDLMMIAEKVGQLKSHVVEIENMKVDRQLDLTDDELDIDIDSLIENQPEIILLKEGLNDSTCLEVYSAGFDDLYVEINEKVTNIIRGKLTLIGDDLEELQENVKSIRITIKNELKKPQTHSVICDNIADSCPLVADLLALIQESFRDGNLLKEKLLKLNDESLAHIKDNVKELSANVNRYVIEPVTNCIRNKK